MSSLSVHRLHFEVLPGLRRARAVLFAIALGTTVAGVLLLSPQTTWAAAEDAGLTDSAATVPGTGEFADLRVTVSQTRNLINQVVTVSWTGGLPTQPFTGQFGINYLQIMQCWGDDPLGPDRTQCQYGVSNTVRPEAGAWVRSRQVSYTFVDPAEALKLPAGSLGTASVPFWAVGKDKPTGAAASARNDFFDTLGTNEIPAARTRGDGTGLEFFEIQTVRQASGLGCGDPVTTSGTVKGRPCWLVIVPRGSAEVDGTTRQSDGRRPLDSSPLSQTNWDNRIVVPLEFLPVAPSCPIGPPERRIVGHELVTDAISSWQPTLCAGGGSLYSYIQLNDEVARNQVIGGSSPGLAMLTNPIPLDQSPPDRPLVYAPVALSGLAIAFNIEHQPAPLASPADQALDGRRFESMRLTPRLVAKLLTQSYRFAVLGAPDYLKSNAAGLTVDPEFLDLNPEYRGFAGDAGTVPQDALVQLGPSDLTALLWSWVSADPDASAFLTGAPDPFGMVVNPANKGLTMSESTFPRNDQACVETFINPTLTLRDCTLDMRPFTNNMHDSGRAASRGDTKARVRTFADQALLRTLPPQNPGQRALLAVIDTATAARYNLPVAALRNTAGTFVTPTTASLLAGVAAMKPSAVAGVLAADPVARDPAAYPLTALSYAVTAPASLDTTAAEDYAAFLRYAAGPGQQPGVAPGQLPLGMAPLPDALRAQTATAAATIAAQTVKATPTPPASPPSQPGTVPSATAQLTGGASAATGSGAAASARAKAPGPGSPPRPGPSATPVLGSTQKPAAGIRRTPALPVPAWVALVLVTVLICGVVAAMSGLAMPLLGAALRRRARKEVTPTEP